MATPTRLTRRHVLGTTVAGAAAVATAGGRLQDTLAARRAPAQIRQLNGRITYWGGMIFAEEANNLLVETIDQWGSDNGV